MQAEQRVNWLMGGVASVLVLFVAACGVGPDATSGSTATSRTTNVTPGAGSQVAVMPAAERYTAVDTIALTVRNGSGQTIYVEAHFTDCSIITLERLVAGAWQTVSECVDGFPHPYVERIPPGTTLAIQLTPASGSAGATESAPSSWPAGTYRAELMYARSATAAFAQGTAVHSATFSVG